MRIRGYILFPTHRTKPFAAPGATVVHRRNASFGKNVTLARNAYIDAMAAETVVLGDGTTLGRNSRIECTGSIEKLGRGIVVGARVGLGTDSFYGCAGGITIGDDTIVGNFVSMHSENHVISDRLKPVQEQGVTHLGIRIGDDCWIGAKATILDGVRLGNGSVVAAGSVVTAGSYEPFGIYGGVPAKRIGTRGSGNE